ncbi:DUF1772 domain-containing protein [Tenacibaculum sp. M341]|uniref:DUF1772 domain-containing protein n=1 Tax=Tenacibaculum sp. M341 TaxID=2530339 RepID=UPI00104BF759|nr:DUF1772 domain-containing protein [Tenacibaculum sp. M341]TCI84711.1 hypothetical protein EYW44_19930 [Tenacibaculum sp. M341]
MNRILYFTLIAVFSIFLGSQITEGFLLVPYWQTLSNTEFHEYYTKFGPTIGKFYTVLTIIAVIVPITVTIYCFYKKSKALKYATASTLFAILIIVMFYGYFKNINHQFYNTILETPQLTSELKKWAFWHCLRVFFEVISLFFLMLTFNRLQKKN